ncbi:MAG: 50S ribosomal protein L16 [Candidatus Aenigmatarchaeota archaeon]
MAIMRPGRCYHHVKPRAFTRTSKRRPRKSYVKGVPVSKIHHFETGNAKQLSLFPLAYDIVSDLDRQFRSNCLEAARQSATKYLTAKLGEQGFFLKVRVFPHNILREKALATGAGADRFSEGMRMSFGRPASQAARVRAGQKIMTARVPEGKEAEIKEALRRASMKLPGSCRVVRASP